MSRNIFNVIIELKFLVLTLPSSRTLGPFMTCVVLLLDRDDDKCVPTSAQRKMLFEELSRLIRINNDLLNALGVGHPALTAVSSASQRLGLASKLTGAGGGGCAFTLLEPTHSTEAQAEKLGADRTAVEELRSILRYTPINAEAWLAFLRHATM